MEKHFKENKNKEKIERHFHHLSRGWIEKMVDWISTFLWKSTLTSHFSSNVLVEILAPHTHTHTHTHNTHNISLFFILSFTHINTYTHITLSPKHTHTHACSLTHTIRHTLSYKLTHVHSLSLSFSIPFLSLSQSILNISTHTSMLSHTHKIRQTLSSKIHKHSNKHTITYTTHTPMHLWWERLERWKRGNVLILRAKLIWQNWFHL